MQRTFLEWVIFFIQNNWHQFLSGTAVTLFISLTGTVVGFFIGLLVALVKNMSREHIGMSNFQMMKDIIFPQMFRNVLPSIGNEFIINIKDTSVLNVISVTELFFISKSVAGTYSRYYEVFIVTSVIYFFLTFTLSTFLKMLEKRIDGPQNFEFLEEQEGGV